ncbi:tryptophan-rich sensory protein [Flavihumibacter sediminis]|nr:tryptophan-rich sensory protein [Flavihumibacter sediminis]
MKNSFKTWAVLGLLAMIAVIIVNAMAVMLPLNGMSTGAISDRYPNLFVPAGFTFSIWSVIYALLLTYTIYHLIVAFSAPGSRIPYQRLESVLNLFVVTCILNISWIFCWHYLQIRLSVIVMLLFLSTLIYIYQKLLPLRGELTLTQKVCIRLPFSVYLGWISVATIANITALLVDMEWQGAGIEAASWSSIMIVVATLLGIYFLVKFKDVAYALVISWALYGIYSRQGADNAMVGNVAQACLFLLLAGAVFTFIRKKIVHTAVD